MRPLAIALALLALPLPGLARPPDADDHGDAPAVLDREALSEQLARVDAAIFEAMSRAKGKQASALRRAREQLDAVRRQVDEAPGPRQWLRLQREMGRWSDAPGSDAPRPGPPSHGAYPAPPPHAVQPISEASLAQLVAAIEQQPTSAGRLAVLQQAAPASWFLVRQVQLLLGRFSFPPDQVQAARLLQPRLLDRENERQLDPWLQAAVPAPVERQSFEARSSVRLQPGVYRGPFTVSGSSAKVEGAGQDQTVIDGDLVITGNFGRVSGLTVLGRVVIRGSQNQLRDVDYRGGIDDRGLLNQY